MRLPRFRPFTWVMLIINVIFLIWMIAGLSQSAGTPQNCGSLSAEACNAAEGVGTAIGLAMVIGLWVAVDFILGIIWLVTRPKTRDCPVCGNSLKRGVTECGKCGTDMAQLHRGNQGHGQSYGSTPPA